MEGVEGLSTVAELTTAFVGQAVRGRCNTKRQTCCFGRCGIFQIRSA